MEALSWNVEPLQCGDTLSLVDLRAKLFPKVDNLEREKDLTQYSEKTLVGNWYEHRAIYVPLTNDWKTVYALDYKPQSNDTYKENHNTLWDNKFKLEGLPPEELLGTSGKEYYSNMTSTYDLSFNVLPKLFDGSKLRFYRARLLKWVPEQDLSNSYGSLTQFGLSDAIKDDLYMFSEEGIAKCRWRTTYKEEIGKLMPMDTERITRFNLQRADYNTPDLRHLERKSPNLQNCLSSFKISRMSSGVKK